MNEAELGQICSRADNLIWSCGCPYLALSEELGYITMYVATHNPDKGLSNFGRLSVRKMMMTAGFSTEYAQFIYEKLEEGWSLERIGNAIAQMKAKEWNEKREEERRIEREREEEYYDEWK